VRDITSTQEGALAERFLANFKNHCVLRPSLFLDFSHNPLSSYINVREQELLAVLSLRSLADPRPWPRSLMSPNVVLALLMVALIGSVTAGATLYSQWQPWR